MFAEDIDIDPNDPVSAATSTTNRAENLLGRELLTVARWPDVDLDGSSSLEYPMDSEGNNAPQWAHTMDSTKGWAPIEKGWHGLMSEVRDKIVYTDREGIR